MGDGKPNIVEKSYKLLFVIYAPIALLGYIINAIGGFNISFLSIFLISISAISAILALILIVRYTIKRTEIISIPDSNKNAPFLYRHDFLIPFIFISITSFTILSLLIYTGAVKELVHHKEVIAVHKKTKIGLLLALSNINDLDKSVEIDNVFYDYGANEMNGLSVFLRYDKDHGNEYDFELIDHKSNYSEKLEEKIIAMMKEGTKYFICTTSPISVPLSRKFEALILKSETKNKPILICTNSSSNKIETKANVVYRLFTRSSEQSALLADKGRELNLKNIKFIAIDNEYGRGALESFDLAWSKKGNLSISGIFLDPALSKNKIIEEILNSDLLNDNPDGLFLASNNNGLDAIIRALYDFPNDIVILAPSGMSIKNNQLEIEQLLAKKRWFVSIPKVKAKESLMTHNVYTSFLYINISKLTHTIEELEENKSLTFHEEWTKTEIPRLLDFEYEKQGDFIVRSRLDSSFTD